MTYEPNDCQRAIAILGARPDAEYANAGGVFIRCKVYEPGELTDGTRLYLVDPCERKRWLVVLSGFDIIAEIDQRQFFERPEDMAAAVMAAIEADVEKRRAPFRSELTPAGGKTEAEATAPKSLDGEIITPEDDWRSEVEAAASVGITMEEPPVPTRAPWWEAAGDDVRQAILREAGPTADAEYRRARVWGRMSEGVRRGLIEAYGRLYRAGKINDAGTIENPRPVLAGNAEAAASFPTIN